MKTKETFFNMDERNKLTAYKVISVMYVFTLIALQGSMLYRQFILGQPISKFEDIAIVVTINSLFLISALLFYGAIPIRKLKLKTILFGYSVFVVAGSLFTYAKYNIFQSPGLSPAQLLDKLFIIFAITGLITFFFVLFSFLGKRKIDKEIEE